MEYKLWINGQWADSKDGKRMAVENPATGEKIAEVIDAGRGEDLVALDEALGALAQFDARKAQVVEMRFFGGLTEEEIAAALGVSPETVRRDWRLARSWLRLKLQRGADNGA